MKSKEVLKLLQITRKTLSHYVKSNIVLTDSKINGHYIYNDDSVYKLIGKVKDKKQKINISYSRVSTPTQKSQLKDQNTRILQSCASRNIVLDFQYEDIKSGMNSDRVGLLRVFEHIFRGEVELLVIENKDRLVRFGFELLEQSFKYFGTKILVLNDTIEDKTYEQELTEDLISIIHYFTMKSYSNRRKLNKLRKELEKETIKD